MTDSYTKSMELLDEIKTYTAAAEHEIGVWFRAARVGDFPENGGACVKYKNMQIAVFNFSRRNAWYACQNLCPHKMQMVLSRGIIGSVGDDPKIACPFHKKTFSLTTGRCVNDQDTCSVAVFPVKVEDGFVYIGFTK